jgi:CRP/FNR family transcriptional regulator
MGDPKHALALEARPKISVARFFTGSPFQGLADRNLPMRICKKGSWIFTQGDVLDGLYIVQEGKVLLTRLSASGRETVLGFAGPGEFFGDVPLLDGNIAPFNARALQSTVLLVVRKLEFKALLDDPASCRAMVDVLARRCNDAWAQIEALGSGLLGEKIRAILLWLSKRNGVQTDEGVEIRMSQSQLAQMVGASRESLNRQISILKSEGAIKVSRKHRRVSMLVVAPEKFFPAM